MGKFKIISLEYKIDASVTAYLDVRTCAVVIFLAFYYVCIKYKIALINIACISSERCHAGARRFLQSADRTSVRGTSRAPRVKVYMPQQREGRCSLKGNSDGGGGETPLPEG